jgi:hypothetical protein
MGRQNALPNFPVLACSGIEGRALRHCLFVLVKMASLIFLPTAAPTNCIPARWLLWHGAPHQLPDDRPHNLTSSDQARRDGAVELRAVERQVNRLKQPQMRWNRETVPVLDGLTNLTVLHEALEQAFRSWHAGFRPVEGSCAA